MSTITQEMYERYTTIGVVIGCIATIFIYTVILYSSNDVITIQEITKAEELCSKNDGLDHIDFDTLSYNDVYCKDTAVFMDVPSIK